MRIAFFAVSLAATANAVRLQQAEEPELMLAQKYLAGYDAFETTSAVHGVVDAAQTAIDELAMASKSAINNQNFAAKAAAENVKTATKIAQDAIREAATHGAGAVQGQASSA